MSIVLAQTAGFCFGVDRAVEMVEQTVRAGKQVVTLGPIIHNQHVMDRFMPVGVRAGEGGGNDPAARCDHPLPWHWPRHDEGLQDRGLEIRDATCPFVKRIHQIVAGVVQKEGLSFSGAGTIRRWRRSRDGVTIR